MPHPAHPLRSKPTQSLQADRHRTEKRKVPSRSPMTQGTTMHRHWSRNNCSHSVCRMRHLHPTPRAWQTYMLIVSSYSFVFKISPYLNGTRMTRIRRIYTDNLFYPYHQCALHSLFIHFFAYLYATILIDALDDVQALVGSIGHSTCS